MFNNHELNALRDYVTGPTSQNQSDTTVRVMVSHSNLKANFMEIRLDKHMSVEAIKKKLCFHSGSAPSAMVLQLKDDAGGMMAVMDDDSRKFGYYSPYDGCMIHIIDTDPTSASANGWLEDVSKVQKYEMSDEDYNKRENTYRKYKLEKLAEDPSWTLEKELAKRRGVEYVPPKGKTTDEEHMAAEAMAVEVGSRCEVEGGKRGVVRFVGKCEGLPLGYWVGVQYDEPVGKNDGSIKGQRYFECGSNYGGFVRPNLVKCGEEFKPFDEDFEFSDGDEL